MYLLYVALDKKRLLNAFNVNLNVETERVSGGWQLLVVSEMSGRQEGVWHMAARCMLVRERLREKLRLLGTPGCWDHLTQQTGPYCCTGLNGRCSNPQSWIWE